MTEYEFGQAVMAAAGVQPEPICKCPGCLRRAETGTAILSAALLDPYAPAGFCALWDSLENRGWRVDFQTLDGTLAQVYKVDWRGLKDFATIHRGVAVTRYMALIEAAASMLGVKRG